MEKRGVDQHDGRETERQSRGIESKVRGDDAENDHQCVDDVEIAPFDGEADDRPRPIAPIELIFLQNVKAIRSRCQLHEVGQRHRNLPSKRRAGSHPIAVG